MDLLHRWARVEHVPEGAEGASGASEGGGGTAAAGGPLTAAEVKAVGTAYRLAAGSDLDAERFTAHPSAAM